MEENYKMILPPKNKEIFLKKFIKENLSLNNKLILNYYNIF